MSRCFPYPPPGFEKSLPLIESIKLQKEREKAKKERKKEKKREKKEKKENSWEDKEKTEAEKHGHNKRRYEELRRSTHKTGDFTKAGEDDCEQVEKSSLTEEQGGPTAVQTLYDSSDSTQNSGKRSKHGSAGVSRTANGSGLRIRLPLSRHKDAGLPIFNERPCFSGRTETVAAQPEPKAGRCETVPAQQGPKTTVHHHSPSSVEQPRFSRTGTTPCEELHKPAQQEPKATVHYLAPPSAEQRFFSGRTGTTPSPVPKAGKTGTVPAEHEEPKATVRHAAPYSAELPYFSRRTGVTPSEDLHKAAQQEPKAAMHHHAPSPADQPCFSGRSGTTPSEELHKAADGQLASVEAGRVHSSCRSYDRGMGRLYKKLILEWKPPPLQVDNPEVDDQDWLFGTSSSRRRHQGQGETKGEPAAGEDSGLGSALCSWPPRACFLPEAGMHALPYVVPF